MPVAKNTFTKGLNQDISLSKYSPENYYYLLNGRVITEEGLSTGSITNDKGNELSFRISETTAIPEPVIIGSTMLRDYLILFIANDPANGYGAIWKVPYNKDTQTYGTVELVYENIISFSKDNRIKAIANYENSSIGKVYWTDNSNNLRHINIFDPDVLTLSPYKLELVNPIYFSKIQVESVDSGSAGYNEGIVLYAYQLYNSNGVETNYSPISNPVFLTAASLSDSTTQNFIGGDPELDQASNKQIKVLINNIDPSYESARIASLYYKKSTDTPDVTIVYDGPSGDSISFIDTATAAGVLAYEEFTAIKSLFKCEDIEVKQNILFAANINEDSSDFESNIENWDARAYRFDASYSIFICGIEGNLNNTESNLAIIDSEHDCIATKENQYTYRYNSDGNLGGSGINISYEFYTTPLEFDNDNYNDSMDADYGTQEWESHFGYPFVNNYGYKDYASPINSNQFTSYQRDEVYRFGICFYDIYGRRSFVKWIGDIKIPAIWEDNNGQPVYDDNGILINNFDILKQSQWGSWYAFPIGIKFNVDTSLIDQYISGWEIVRAERTASDKTIVAQGVLGAITDVNGNDNTISIFSQGTVINTYELKYATESLDKQFTFMSPEVSYNNENFNSNDCDLQLIGITENYIETIDYSTFPDTTLFTRKIKGFQVLPDYGNYSNAVNDWSREITNSSVIDPNGKVTTTDNNTFHNRTYRVVSEFPTVWEAKSFGGRQLFIEIDSSYSAIPYSPPASSEIPFFNIVKRDTSSIYGGYSFNNRLNTEYIPTGGYRKKTSSSAYIYGGDTFITYFDFTNVLYLDDHGATWNAYQAQAYIPCESKINTRYNGSGEMYHSTNGLIPTQSFKYMSSYLTHINPSKFFSKPYNYDYNKKFDYRIQYSDVKVYGDLTDSWLKFYDEQKLDIDSNFGPIKSISRFNNKLIFLQETGIGYANVNDRVLITPSNNPSTLILGQSGVLDGYAYLSESSGTKHRDSVVSGESGLYYFDSHNKAIKRVGNDANINLTTVYGLSSYFKNYQFGKSLSTDDTLNGYGVHSIYDKINNRILFTFLNSPITDFTLSFNENLNAFESFFSFTPNIYMYGYDNIMSIDNTMKSVYEHNIGDYGKYYGSVYDTRLESIFNQEPDFNKLFNVIEYSFHPQDGNFYNIRYLNDTQSKSTAIDSSNSSLRLNKWRFNGLRDANGGRMRDRYMRTRLDYDNSNNLNISINDIVNHYTVNIQ